MRLKMSWNSRRNGSPLLILVDKEQMTVWELFQQIIILKWLTLYIKVNLLTTYILICVFDSLSTIGEDEADLIVAGEFLENLEKMFLCTICVVMLVGDYNLEIHDMMLAPTKG